MAMQHTEPHCNTLHHTVTHCNTLQHASQKKAKRAGGAKAFATDGDVPVKMERPPELPLCEIDRGLNVSVNRSPVMVLWSAVVAQEVCWHLCACVCVCVCARARVLWWVCE